MTPEEINVIESEIVEETTPCEAGDVNSETPEAVCEETKTEETAELTTEEVAEATEVVKEVEEAVEEGKDLEVAPVEEVAVERPLTPGDTIQ